MSIYKKMGFGLSNSNPVVLDIGEAYTKLGFAGDAEPRAIIPTTIEQVGGPLTHIFHSNKDAVITHHYHESLTKSITKFLEKIFYKALQINAKNQRVILCESLLNPTKIRQTIAAVLFNHFEVASLVFAPHHLLSCFTVATGTAIVVDCSYGETLVIPVIEGTPVLWAWQAAPLGGAAIHDEIMSEIAKGGKLQVGHNPPECISTRLSEQVLEDIKVKACFVANYNRAKIFEKAKLNELAMKEKGQTKSEDQGNEERPAIPNIIYPLDGATRLIIPGSIRNDAPEILFQQDNDRTSIPTLVLDSLLHCPMVSRKELTSGILVTGGTSMLPGFKHRLLFELKELAKTEERYSKLSEFEFRVHNPPVLPNLVAWLGASVFASLETFKRRLVTKEYFDQHNGKLPDWCGPPFPEKMPEPQLPRSSTNSSGKACFQLPSLKSK